MPTKSVVSPAVRSKPDFRIGDLYIHALTQMVVLVTGDYLIPDRFAGAVVHGGSATLSTVDSAVGNYSPHWSKVDFIPYYGTLTLESV